ncbi:hypothetical protein EK21DRAFT_53651 [Setomelanomma holmii]|uniref:N-acetyltransferase domain-containing protein n=1 Tax=Setomelanomma holmii TaxID=210430 RepID=A0A9P4HMX2_9PLEO|nr:hypothetical protein EK21DRAFT_53651 [Setomelanomma holmii]
MKILSTLHLSLWFQAFLFLHHHVTKCEQQVLAPQARLRKATLEDVDDITTILITAFSSSPHWQYLYQFRKDFPEEHRRCARLNIALLLLHPSSHAEVIEAPADSDISLAAFAIWTRKKSSSLRSLSGLCLHRDMNSTRAIDYAYKAAAAEKKYIDDAFGPDQLYLEYLATHPDYQLRGAGTRLTNSGLESGRKARVNITLLALPTAEGFYAHLNFSSVANMSISSVDGDQLFRFNVMARDFSGKLA